MRTFAGIEPEYGGFDKAEIFLQSIPYDGTSTWGKGADQGFEAFLEAAENMEIYDIETDSEVYRKGIHILPEISESSSPESVYATVLESTLKLLEYNKFLTFIGGEHSVSIGIIEAFRQHDPDITILQLDAHADLRQSYLGTEYNHACALHKASLNTNLIQVGIRSMDSCEKQFMKAEKVFFDQDLHFNDDWMDEAIALMSGKVYLTLDLDVFNPAIMPATGTPEPGGMDWYQVLRFLKKVFEARSVTGFDIVEFAPMAGNKAPAFLVAKLYYKLLSYRFTNGK